MPEEKRKIPRLGKAAEEFNVSIGTIITLLKKKNFDITNNPNTKLTEEIYDILLREFAKDKLGKAEADKIEIGTIVAKASAFFEDTGENYKSSSEQVNESEFDRKDIVKTNTSSLSASPKTGKDKTYSEQNFDKSFKSTNKQPYVSKDQHPNSDVPLLHTQSLSEIIDIETIEKLDKIKDDIEKTNKKKYSIETYIDYAIKNGKSITIKYIKSNGEISTRKVSDLKYSTEYGYKSYIEGYCHLRKEKRTFKISKIWDVDGIKSSISEEGIDKTHPVEEGVDKSKMNKETYIDYAIKNGKSITIKYVKFNGETSTRLVSDLKYSTEYGYKSHIEGYCHLRKENRTFKISRIREVDGIKSSISEEGIDKNKSAYKPNGVNRVYYPPVTYSRQTNKKEGCYIATMVYGDYDHPKVLKLRKFRDEILMKSLWGRCFIKVYYFVSPKAVRILNNRRKINILIRKGLDKWIEEHI